MRHWHHSSLILIKHKKLSITDLAYFTRDFFAILQLYRARKRSRAQPTVITVEHGAEFALHRLFQFVFACEAVCLLIDHLVARSVITHL